jgi:hypothetical protein
LKDIGKSDEDDEWARERGGLVLGVLGYQCRRECPIKTLGEMSRFFPFFEIPIQTVELQCSFDQELEKANRGRYNLWAFGVLTHLLPVSIPVPTPNHEVFFSEALVRRALPGLEPGNQSMSALAVNEGVPVAKAAVEGVTTNQLNRMVIAQRLAAAHGGDGKWPVPQIALGIYDYTANGHAVPERHTTFYGDLCGAPCRSRSSSHKGGEHRFEALPKQVPVWS